jgi:hypothetical protein
LGRLPTLAALLLLLLLLLYRRYWYKVINIGAVNYCIQRDPAQARLAIGPTNCHNWTHVGAGVGSLLMHYLTRHAAAAICVLRLNPLNIPRAHRLITAPQRPASGE